MFIKILCKISLKFFGIDIRLDCSGFDRQWSRNLINRGRELDRLHETASEYMSTVVVKKMAALKKVITWNFTPSCTH